MSNSENSHGTPDLPASPSTARLARVDFAIALAVGAGLATACTLVFAVGGSPADGASLGAAAIVPATMLAYVVLRRQHRDRFEFTDERAQIIELKSRAQGFLALVGLLAGVSVYRWLTDGFTAAEPYVNILIAGSIVQFATRYAVKRAS